MSASQATPGSAIALLNVPRGLKAALADAGYKYVEDVKRMSAEDMCAELAISRSQADDLCRQAATFKQDTNGSRMLNPALPSSSQPPLSQIQSSTAADLLSTSSLPHFSTSSISLDTLIGHFCASGSSQVVQNTSRKGKERENEGTIVPGMTIEISGPPGGGKSVLALSIAISARLSSISGEADGGSVNDSGEVLIIDTEGAMTAERLHQAAKASIRKSPAHEVTASRSVVEGIHLVRVISQVQMAAVLHTLDEWLEAHPKVNLVVFDTLSHHFRQPGMDITLRRRIMDLAKQRISQAATVHHCAVIVCNQLATKLLTAENKPANFDTGDRAVLMPQLGDWWTTGKTLRLVVFRGGPSDEMRYAYASMSGGNKDVPWATFDIDENGIPRDVPGMLHRRPSPAA